MRIKRVLLLFFSVGSIFVLCRALYLGNYPDFSIYYIGTELFISGVNPYTAWEVLRVPFLYPPHTLLLFTPLTLFSLKYASIIWILINIMLLYGSLYIMLRIYNIRIFSTTSLVFILLGSIFFPVKYTLGMGQINIFLLFFLMLFIYWYKNMNFAYASAALGITILLKIVPIIFLPYILIKKKITLFYSIIVFLFITTGIIMVFINISILQTYVVVVLPELFLSPWKGDYYNQALSGFLTRHIVDVDIRSMLKNVISLLLSITTYYILWRKRHLNIDLLGFSFLIVLSLIISSFSWQHHFVWLLFPFLVIFQAITKNKLHFLYILLGFCYILTAINIREPENIPLILQSHVLYGTLLLWLLHLYLLVKHND